MNCCISRLNSSSVTADDGPGDGAVDPPPNQSPGGATANMSENPTSLAVLLFAGFTAAENALVSRCMQPHGETMIIVFVPRVRTFVFVLFTVEVLSRRALPQRGDVAVAPGAMGWQHPGPIRLTVGERGHGGDLDHTRVRPQQVFVADQHRLIHQPAADGGVELVRM
uniref:Uncharacterized protein n=1 Tax=Zea mays TaxID=4577 RepID=C0PE08_MAIZE|nr:unknown [Zea mays]